MEHLPRWVCVGEAARMRIGGRSIVGSIPPILREGKDERVHWCHMSQSRLLLLYESCSLLWGWWHLNTQRATFGRMRRMRLRRFYPEPDKLSRSYED